jgi:hypothetical protein
MVWALLYRCLCIIYPKNLCESGYSMRSLVRFNGVSILWSLINSELKDADFKIRLLTKHELTLVYDVLKAQKAEFQTLPDSLYKIKKMIDDPKYSCIADFSIAGKSYK